MNIPEEANVVIIGGGVIGCSIAYHLGKLGWKDILLLERKKLTCGTTWHAAGLIAQLRATQNMTRLAKYSQELYWDLEKETGVVTGFKRNGSMTVALSEERLEELNRQADMARAYDVEIENIDKAEIKSRYPHLNTEDVLGGLWLPKDGQADPVNITQALAKGARNFGVKILEDVKVLDIETKDNKISGVKTEKGYIKSKFVVNAGGMWGQEIGKMAGASVPLHACEHFYIVTEPVDGLGQLPVLRVPDEYAYYKEDAGKMLLGAFEPNAKPWGMGGIPEEFCFDQLPEDIDHFEQILEMGVNRLPLLGKVGIHTFFNGPESFTPDDRYYLGEAPELAGYWVAAGYNSIGIVSSGGAGMALASWINDGYPPFDLWDVDIRRVQPFQQNKKYLKERVSETLGLLYADHYPYRQMETSRGIRRSVLHDVLRSQGAVFGEVAGFERANWFSLEDQKQQYEYDWGKQNWFNNQKLEHLAVRQGVGLFDMSSFGKIRVEGKDSLVFLQRLCAAQLDVEVGSIVYTQMLNANGGIEADLTVSRLSETSFLLVVPCATLQRDLSWLKKHQGDLSVVILDFTGAEAVLSLMGPLSRDVLSYCSPNDFSNGSHPFGQWRNIEIGMGLARAHRVSYVGELGWEIYVSTDQAQHVFESIQKAGYDYDLKLCGMHTLDSCRVEKAYRHFGHDITDEDHVLEAGLGFAVKVEKGQFLGREAVLKKREQGLSKVLLQFCLKDPEAMMFHNEPILRDGSIVGYITSANYGHFLEGAVGLGYVPCLHEDLQEVLASKYQIEIAGKQFETRVSARPMYDPKSLKVKV